MVIGPPASSAGSFLDLLVFIEKGASDEILQKPVNTLPKLINKLSKRKKVMRSIIMIC